VFQTRLGHADERLDQPVVRGSPGPFILVFVS
jgi:hypothetical protein